MKLEAIFFAEEDKRLEGILDDIGSLVKAMELDGALRPGEIDILGSGDDASMDDEPEDEINGESSEYGEMDPKDELRLLMEPVEGSDDDDEEDEVDDRAHHYEEEQLSEDDVSSKDTQQKNTKQQKQALLDESDSDDEMTPFQRQQARLRQQISSLEREQLDPKSWMLSGEVTAKARPMNSLLEEHVDFDQGIGLTAATSRAGPIVTEEATESIEQMIIGRIKLRAYDDVQLRFAVDKDASEARKEKVELNQEKSAKSLAELYEDDYIRATKQQSNKPGSSAGGVVADAKTAEARVSIERRFEKICEQLDALSESRFATSRKYSIAPADLVIRPLSSKAAVSSGSVVEQ